MTKSFSSRAVITAMFVLLAAAASASEIVILKGGKELELSKPYVVRGSQAILTLKDGTVMSVVESEIDKPATRAARARRAPKKTDAEEAAAVSPADAARAQKKAAKARLKVGDDDVTHPYVAAGDEAEKGPGEGDARVDVVDWDQTAADGTLLVKGNLRNSGSSTADGLSLQIIGKDDKGKTLATTSANVAAGTLDAGAVTSFTATLAMPAKAASLRFVPKWSSAVVAVKPEKEKAGEIATAMAKKSAAAAASSTAAPGAEAGPAAPAAPAQPAYVPRPDYAPPMANAPTSPPDDNRVPYIPNLHEETPPPPPPPPN